MTRASLLWIAVLCSCARSGGDERRSDRALKRAPTGASVASGSAVAIDAGATTAIDAGAATPVDAGPARATAPDASRPTAAASTGSDLTAAFEQRLAAAKGACTTADDCGCFTSIVDSPQCAGITDATSARALNDLAARFRSTGCRLPRRCGPGSCEPQCTDQRCR